MTADRSTAASGSPLPDPAGRGPEPPAGHGYSGREYAARVLWTLARPAFRLSPRTAFAWRRFLLRLFGAKVGRRVRIYPSAHVYLPWMFSIGDDSAVGEHALVYCLGPVRIGRGVTISQRTHLCGGTHDYRDPAFPLIRSPITVEDEAWVCADAFVGPHVTVGRGAIIGARAAVFKDCEPYTVYGGNPARAIKPRDPPHPRGRIEAAAKGRPGVQ